MGILDQPRSAADVC